MRALQRGMTPWKVAVLVLLVVVVATVAAFTKRNPFADRFELKAAFSTVNDLKAGSPVRIAGIEVGRVRRVEPRGTAAVVTMEIREEGLPIHRDARLKVRPRIFLEGNYFVDLRPGTPSAPVVGDGDVIPASQTAAPVQFGQVLEALQADTREDLQRVLQELGSALDQGGAKAFNRTTEHWAPAYRWSAVVNDATRGTTGRDLSGYIDGAGRVAAGLDRDRAALKSLITDFATTAQAFASEQQNLRLTIDRLPAFLAQGTDALTELSAGLPGLRRIARAGAPAVRESGPALEAQLPLARQLRGLMTEPELRGLSRDLRAATPSLAALSRETIPFAEQQRLLSSCQSRVILPWQEDKIEDPNFPVTGKVYQEGVKWLPGIAGESRSFDANGQYVRSLAKPPRFATPLGEGRFLFTGDPIGGVNPPAQALPPFRPDVPCETQPLPDLRTKVQPAPPARRIDDRSPAARERRARMERRLRSFMRENLSAQGIEIDIRDTPLKREELPRLFEEVTGR